MKKIEGIIFDWAGTAVDFGCFAPVNVFIEIFKQAGIDVTMEEARIPMGMLKRDHIKTMMDVVTKGAKEKGYAPDFYVTPDSTNSNGRPYPYMIYRNMEALKLVDTSTVVKVGDTNSDIKEGLAAGVWSVGVIVGSSNMGLSEDEYNKLSQTEKDNLIEKTKAGFMEAGAHFTINTIKELPELIEKINELIKEGKRPYAINEKLA
ncbi:phosphonoacetaldehyde hydrolase [Clostridium butyricum]|uniref:phosphonoacetaldehyde hydrolase n=1 Tax=Clostridium butyricum TaxID=1492 RepID=UPI0034676721